MSAHVKKIVLKTPAAVGSTAQYSALERCRTYQAQTSDALAAAQSAASQAQAAQAVAVAAKDTALAASGGVKITLNDTGTDVLNNSLSVTAPLAKNVVNPGGNESLSLSVASMGGASASNAGLPGTVPPPQAGDQQKFLRGDATWRTLDKASLGLSAVEDTWSVLPGAVVMLSASQAAVAGNCLALALPGGQTGRAIKADAPAGASGHVAAASYDAPNSRTLIAVDGFSLTGETAQLSVGQDPANAPAASSAGSDLYLAENYTCLIY